MAAAAASGTLLSSGVRASITVNLRLANGATSTYIGGDQTNTDIPIQVWATVTSTQAMNPVPVAGNYASNPQITAGTGDYFDGLQYLYYNVLNSNSAGTYITGGIDTASGKGPTLNATLGFNANGSQLGAVQNIAGGVSVGSTSSITGVAKPRAAHAVFDNPVTYNQSGGVYQELGNDGTNIIVSGNTVSFLVETINFKPTAYASATNTTFTLSSPSAALAASAATDLSQANWFENVSNQSGGSNGQPSGGTNANGSPTIGTSVTIQDTLQGDANLDGRVSSSDFATLRANFGTGTKWSQGDFNSDGRVSSADFAALRANFGLSVTASAAPAMKASTLATQYSAASQIGLVVNTTTGDAQLSLSNFSLEQYEIYSAGGQLIASNLKSVQSQGYGGFTTTNTTVGNTNNDISEESGTATGALTTIIDLGNIFNKMYAAAGTRDLDFSGTDGTNAFFDVPVTYVTASSPEPTSFALLCLGLAGLVERRRRR